MASRHSYAFGDFTLDLTRGALLKGGADVKLRPKSFEVLRLLVERHGQLLTKDELLDAVWGRTIVTEGSLTQCLLDIRRAIGDETQGVIRTVPRRGYIFDVPVTELSESIRPAVPVAAPATPAAPPVRRSYVSRGVLLSLIVAVLAVPAAWWLSMTRSVDANAIVVHPGAARAPHNSIAVLPFVNMSPDPDQEYFSEGVSEEILNLLAQAPDLQVIARTSSFSFKGQNVNVAEIAAKLNVAYVLEGSVRKSGARLRITAQLVDAANSAHLWSKTYDRDERDTFAVQSEIAARVAEALKTTLAAKLLAPAQSGSYPAAYEDFLRARFFYHRRGPGDIERARVYYSEALRRYPGYARAWAGLAGVYGVQIGEAAIPVATGL